MYLPGYYFRFYGKNRTTTSTTTEAPIAQTEDVNEDGTVIKVMKLADDQIKDILNAFKAGTTTTTASTTATTITSTQTKKEQLIEEQESGFLQLMRRVGMISKNIYKRFNYYANAKIIKILS